MTGDPRVFHAHQPQSANWSCLFGERREGPRCGEPATWHGLILTWDAAALRDVTACCDEHRPDMARAVDFVHAMESVCGLPGSMCHWDGPSGRSWCELDWSPGAALERVAEDLAVLATGCAR